MEGGEALHVLPRGLEAALGGPGDAQRRLLAVVVEGGAHRLVEDVGGGHVGQEAPLVQPGPEPRPEPGEVGQEQPRHQDHEQPRSQRQTQARQLHSGGRRGGSRGGISSLPSGGAWR